MEHVTIPNKITRLDGVCGVEVCAMPVSPELLDTSYGKTAHLQIVSMSGELFTHHDLHRMGYNLNESDELFDLCRRRIHAMRNVYLPDEYEDVKIIGVDSYVDNDGKVRVTFYLSGHTQ